MNFCWVFLSASVVLFCCFFMSINCDFLPVVEVSVSCRVSSGAATVVHNHRRDLPVDDLLLAVEVEHVDGRHLGGRAAGPRRAPGIGLVHQVCVRVLLQM